MALETRHTEKQMLFNLLFAMRRDPALKASSAFNEVVISLMAVMEEEDIAVVEKKIKMLDS